MLQFFGFQRAKSAVLKRALTSVMRYSAAKCVTIALCATRFNLFKSVGPSVPMHPLQALLTWLQQHNTRYKICYEQSKV